MDGIEEVLRENAMVREILEARWKQVKRLEQENKQLREALQQLYDEQNGPPLLQWADGWERVMELAREALEGSGD